MLSIDIGAAAAGIDQVNASPCKHKVLKSIEEVRHVLIPDICEQIHRILPQFSILRQHHPCRWDLAVAEEDWKSKCIDMKFETVGKGRYGNTRIVCEMHIVDICCRTIRPCHGTSIRYPVPHVRLVNARGIQIDRDNSGVSKGNHFIGIAEAVLVRVLPNYQIRINGIA